MLTEYLDEIMSKGLALEHTGKDGKKTYSLTEKGFSFLNDYQVIRKFFDSYGFN